MQQGFNAYINEHAVVEPTGEGPLSGMDFAVKDVFALAGHASSAGNPDWLRTHGPAEAHAEAVARLLASGGRLKGTTITDELMFSLNGENIHYGTPVNPKAPGSIPGGSSSGSAVAAAAGLADFALGTDTGGSIRIPSSYCGLYGIRPTHGLVSLDGVIPLAASFDTVGWMARDAATMQRVGEVLIGGAGESAGGAFKRLVFATDAWDVAEADCRRALADTAAALEGALDVRKLAIAPQGLEAWFATFRTMQGYEIWSAHGAWIAERRPKFGPGIAERFAWSATLTRDDYERALPMRQRIRESLAELLGDDSLLVIPTAPCSAPRIGLTGAQVERTRMRAMQLSCIAGLGGLPQATIPLQGEDGRPVGLSFIAGPRQDAKLLRWIRDTASRALPPQSVV
ncbi:amidase [Paenibacillus rhizovicinus]|uniref:Amidase n=1 Tax=Paenibacillus rhizovicinus TaxID=2704463 RepID=A0A6C0NTE9_9BACL|nr:amidase [Paenibacillus rhizovicinus]QHW29474.1 amidase [Paenibacillus rhizovicinus]